MKFRIDPAVDRLLIDALGRSPELIPFARAVVAQLTAKHGGGWVPAEAVHKVVLALGVGETRPRELFPLHLHPELMASFFQNMDLLEPGQEKVGDVFRSVMTALEAISDG